MCHRSVGLIQNVIESHGVSTVSLTVHPHISKKVGVPRGLYLRFPQGNLFGEPFRPEQQRSILTTALEIVEVASGPGTIYEYPSRWRSTSARGASPGEQ